MAPSNVQHRRAHHLLLISKLLNQREPTSPFTLVIDKLEQSGKPLLREYVRRANAAKLQVIFIAFETLRCPPGVDVFVPAWREPWQEAVAAHITGPHPNRRSLVILDSLSSLCATHPSTLPALLAGLITPSTALLALYHADVPCPATPPPSPYTPAPLTQLRFLATTLLTPHAVRDVLARRAARARSAPELLVGLGAGVEGVLQGVGKDGAGGCVLEMEHRRKSGREVGAWYYLPYRVRAAAESRGEVVVLLEDFVADRYGGDAEGGLSTNGNGDGGMTFELGMTERQRRDREGVVLPYTDAQKGGGGEGGRILYEMGREDDFDEEEDEI